MPDNDVPRPELIPLERRDAAFELQRALARKRHGHAKNLTDHSLHMVVSELLADALADVGVVLAVPRYPDPTIGKPVNPNLTD